MQRTAVVLLVLLLTASLPTGDAKFGKKHKYSSVGRMKSGKATKYAKYLIPLVISILICLCLTACCLGIIYCTCGKVIKKALGLGGDDDSSSSGSLSDNE
mmetsp:Transcript_52802/g.150534  ORF Transcript_52802/g.150534 Transcript_52802/m.150534 type:complete len:100 (-) Transcript_52802:29-328(-)